MNNPILMVDPTGMAADTIRLGTVLIDLINSISDFQRLYQIHQVADQYSTNSDGRRDHRGYAGMTLMMDKATGGMGDLTGSRGVAGRSSLKKIFGKKFNPWKVLKTNNKFDKGAHQLAKEIGGIAQARFNNSTREFDAISDELIGQPIH